MIGSNGFHYKKAFAVLLALVLTVMVPMAAFAQTAPTDAAATADATTAAQNAPQGQQPQMGAMKRGQGAEQLDTSALTDEQKAVYEKALKLYEEIEDAVLADLVTANVVTQADADSYTALRTAQKSLGELDQSAWTAAQYKAYYEAVAQKGDARKTALQALADAGQLTQAQADAMSAENQPDLWNKISENANTNTAIQTALNTLNQARQTMQATLKAAGISTGAGDRGFGMGNNSGMPGQNNGRHGNQPDSQNGPMQGDAAQGNSAQGEPASGN